MEDRYRISLVLEDRELGKRITEFQHGVGINLDQAKEFHLVCNARIVGESESFDWQDEMDDDEQAEVDDGAE